MIKQALTWMICITFSFCSYSQIFKGKVIDGNNSRPIDIVSVSITDADNMTLVYTATDAKGGFELEYKDNPESKYLFISCLGYQSQKILLTSYKNNTEITLSKTDVKLKEVIVKMEPIKQKGDTLNYEVSAFRLGQDRNIRDVLKRLPGIEVDNSGQIKYEGKPINKFYVENMDLTDGKYNLISNNLSAKSVKTVQVLEKHQPVNVLQGINSSDKAALNLVLEDAAKGKIVGVVDLGLGIEKKSEKDKAIWENRLIALLFKNRFQNISLYKNSNTGIDIKEDLTDFQTGVSSQQASGYNQGSSVFQPLLASGTYSFKKQRWFFNDAHIISQNSLSKISKNSFLRIQTSYLHEKETQRSQISTSYFLPNNTISISEDHNNKDISNEIQSRISYELNSKKNYVKNTTDFHINGESNEGIIQNPNSLTQKLILDKFTLSNDFSFVKRLNDDKAFKFSSFNSFDRLPQRISILPGLYNELIGNNTQSLMEQKVIITSLDSHSYTSFSHSLFMFGVDYNLGVDIKSQYLESSPSFETSSSLGNFSDSLSNKYRFTNLSAYLSPRLRFQRKYLDFSLALKSTLMNLNFNDIFRNQLESNKTKFIFEPMFNLNYQIDAFWKISLNSYYQKSYSDIRSLYTGYILNSYRTISKYNNQLYYNATFSNSINVSYKQPIKGLFVYFLGNFSRRFQDALTRTTFEGIMQKNSIDKRNVVNNSLLTTFNISKTLPWWKSEINIKHSFMSSDFTQDFSGTLSEYKTTSHTISSSLTLSPIRQFNMEGSAKFFFQQLKRTIPSIQKNPMVRSSNCELTFNFIPNKTAIVSWENELYHNNLDNSTKYYSDLSISFSLKKNEVQLIANNLFNANKYEKYNVQDFTQSSETIYLHKRQVILKYLFNF